MNTTIYDAGIGIKLLVDGTKGFVNGNSFQFLKMYTNNIFIDFGMDPLLESKFVLGSKESGIHGNYFQNLQCHVRLQYNTRNKGYQT